MLRENGEGKKRNLADQVDRMVWNAPWMILAVLAFSLLPGYFWWLATGDAASAKRIVRLWLSYSFAALLAFFGAVAFYFPFWRIWGTESRPSPAERLGGAALGGLFWAEAAAIASGTFGLSLLVAARVGTAVFIVGLAAGLLVQRRVAAGMRGENRSGREIS